MSKPAVVRIESVDQLKQECHKRWRHGFIAVAGNGRSSKDIMWGGRKFHVTNYIDGTDRVLTPEELSQDTNIVAAIKYGAFYLEVEDG